MRVSKFLPASFIYVQGLSLANPIYLVFLLLLFKNCWATMFRSGQLLILLLLLFCQLLAIWATPHEMPMSTLSTLLGLFAFAVRPDRLFDYKATDVIHQSFRRILVSVLLIYFADSLLRVQHLHFNWIGWSDYELKELIKSNTWLADDTNTLGIRVLLIYFIACSIGLLSSRPWMLRGIFLYLTLTCYSRAAIVVLLLVFLFEMEIINRAIKNRYLLIASIFSIVLVIAVALPMVDDINLDSSEISKLELIVGSFEHWWVSGWWERLVGLGYHSNLDVGTLNWASGHSFVYYAIVDFGVFGTLLLGALILRCARTSQARWLLVVYLILGLSVFRFDFLFLYIALFFVEHVRVVRKNRYKPMWIISAAK